jgi:hypothetical protein
MGIQIFKNSGGTSLLSGVLQLATGTELNASLKNVTDQLNTNSPLQLSTRKAAISMPDMIETTGTFTGFDITRRITNTAGNSIYRQFNNTYTINNSGAQTGSITGIFLNATETALNGMSHNLMDLQLNGVSNFSVSRIGQVNTLGSINSSSNMSVGGTSQFVFGGRSRIYSDANSNIRLTNSAGNDFNLLQFGGITNSFPSIKRKLAAIDFRLADDSNFCEVNTGVLSIQNTVSEALGVASTNKVTISIGGVTYFLLATNV